MPQPHPKGCSNVPLPGNGSEQAADVLSFLFEQSQAQTKSHFDTPYVGSYEFKSKNRRLSLNSVDFPQPSFAKR